MLAAVSSINLLTKRMAYQNVCGIQVRRRVSGKVVDGIKGLGEAVRRVQASTTPHVTERKSIDVELGHDTKVVASAAESPVQVGVLGGASSNDEARGSNDFVAGDIVTCPSQLVGKVGNTATKEETRDTNGRHLRRRQLMERWT